MHNKITMEMSICQAENGFSLDELVKKVADSYEKKAFADILKMNLQLTQEILMYRIFNNKNTLQCCPDGHLTQNGSFDRRIRTSLGEFKMAFWRVRCSKCGKSFAPLASSSAWSITKPKLMSLKSWLSKLQVVQIIAEQLKTWNGMESFRYRFILLTVV